MSLLASIYDLPKLGLLCPFDRDQASKMGSRWIAFHHFMPDPELITWIEEARPFVLTTVRHPGDVLISLYHHIRGFTPAPVDMEALRDMLHKPFERNEIYPPAFHTFREELACSIEWKRTGLTRVVRYEDLRRDSMATLLALTGWMGAVSTERIEQAIERCDINLMRSLAGNHSGFFRSGEVGGWRSVLASEIIDDFGAEPYRSQVEELGYSFEARDREVIEYDKASSRNPFRILKAFDNGVSVAPILIDLYLSLDRSISEQWSPADSTGPQSYFQWLNQSLGGSEHGCYGIIRISNLLHYLHRHRPDLAQRFPDLGKSDRAEFAEWLMQYAEREYQLDPVFLAELRKSYFEWGTSPSTEDRVRSDEGSYGVIRLSNFLHYLHQTRPNLAHKFPRLCGSDRAEYADWLLKYAVRELHVHEAFLAELRNSYLEWANSRSRQDRDRRPWWPKLTNFALHVYGSSPGAQEAFPEVYDRDRWDFLEWMVRSDTELDALPEVIEPIRKNLRKLGKLRSILSRIIRPESPAP